MGRYVAVQNGYNWLQMVTNGLYSIRQVSGSNSLDFLLLIQFLSGFRKCFDTITAILVQKKPVGFRSSWYLNT
jgi:hypothetical protein